MDREVDHLSHPAGMKFKTPIPAFEKRVEKTDRREGGISR